MSRRDIFKEAMGLSPISSSGKLFEKGDVTDSLINRGLWLNHEAYQVGYIGAAVSLLDLIKMSDSNSIKDSYIFVALFCFRHYLELTMKDSLINYYDNKERTDIVNGYGHDLVKLYNEIIKLPNVQQDNTTNTISNIINTLQGIDSTGTVFRYPYKIDGETGKICSSFNVNIGLKSIPVLRKRMLQMYLFFDGINMMVHDYERNGMRNFKRNVTSDKTSI